MIVKYIGIGRGQLMIVEYLAIDRGSVDDSRYT